MVPKTVFIAATLALGFTATTAAAQTATAPKTPPAHARLTNFDKFTTVAAAQASCPTDTVVWSSLKTSHSFHMPNSKYYGKTKHGAYVCEHAALSAGFHQAKT